MTWNVVVSFATGVVVGMLDSGLGGPLHRASVRVVLCPFALVLRIFDATGLIVSISRERVLVMRHPYLVGVGRLRRPLWFDVIASLGPAFVVRKNANHPDLRNVPLVPSDYEGEEDVVYVAASELREEE